ncbi:hypothetical protein [Paeniglutamicibacter gangotriensis]|uniref:Uncharacterized protein n=2 Tax=Paeniglutamicibacter gangotriensis TaxID=254787 RepID=M7MP04_9MICC|nr:hypothetical protein [Paeniglutamicibacter gangotriensis]EMQ96675.1 hypothetical protein ADIAG_04001 [Paeniglutamicibacter gangotriensis Lz1y]KAA0975268.1 hypothetical protein FQ154_13770 [Paeniglutamicibacter gangotriensis]
MASSPTGDVEGDGPGWLIASMALIFDEPLGLEAHRRILATLRARQSISLLATPVPWGELSVIELVIAVNPEGFIVMADEEGNLSNGQQIEGFAIALKRGTGAKYADLDGVDAESGETITDKALEYPTGGISVLLGSFKESEVALFAGESGTSWSYFTTEHGDVAVHDGYMPEIMVSRSSFPAIMLSRLGPRFSMVFWFQDQNKKLRGHPGFGHGWSVAAEPVLEALPGTPAAEVNDFLTDQWAAPDLDSIAELTQYGISAEIIGALEQALAGSGSVQKLREVLEIFGTDPSQADYVEEGSLPATARPVEQRGLGGAIAHSMRAEAKDATGVRKFFNVIAWRPGSQILWGFLQAVIAVALVVLTDWDQTRLPFWVIVVVAALWGVDALTNLWVGGWRLARARQSRD